MRPRRMLVGADHAAIDVVQVPVHLALPLQLGQHAEALYRIAQEALANVVKHARAQRAGVTIAARAGWVGVRIEDEGVGFPPEARERLPGDACGLRGMHERVLALGGTLRIGNGSTGGAYVQVELPVARAGGGPHDGSAGPLTAEHREARATAV